MTDRRLERLRWRCRRGMLELDLILARTLVPELDRLSADELDIVEQLLELEDTTLFDYLRGSAEPAQMELRQLVEKIRQ